MLGAISTHYDQVVYTMDSSTSTASVSGFFQELRRHTAKDAVIVLDNHGSHHAGPVRDLMTKYRYSGLYLPVGSSDLNPVERIWSIMKAKWATKLLELRGAVDEKFAKQHLGEILDGIAPATVRNLAKNDCRLMLKIIKSEILGDRS